VNESGGTILYGANNIFLVRGPEGILQCRIKGKVLSGGKGDYNPLAAGDRVRYRPDPGNPGNGVLLEREERRNALARWNRKGRAPQTLAANLDLVVCVASPHSPPFRPRFLDRLLVACDREGIPGLVCLNKIDQGSAPWIDERLEDFRARGVPVLLASAAENRGLDILRDRIRGKRAVFVGQSGVGKTSILNRLLPGVWRKVGRVCEKYNRGSHTTVLAYLEEWEGGELIDTPGVREFEPHGIPPDELRFLFQEFAGPSERCAYPRCTHSHEPSCAVREAAESGEILPDRYESYLRIFDLLSLRERRAP